ncbi:hypothetical protein ACYSNW_07285 [Enterococcus sp. LJL99]
MSNYILSDFYRLIRMRIVYVLVIGSIGLMGALAMVLKIFKEQDTSFRYATDSYYYGNVLGLSLLLLFVAFMFTSFLTRKNQNMIGQAISFGYSRKQIFWGKFLLQLGVFSLFCLVSMLFLVGLGQTLLPHEDQVLNNFLLALSNMAPIILAGFCISYILNLLGVRETVSIVLLLVVFNLIGKLGLVVFKVFPALKFLNDYLPNVLLSNNLNDFMELSVRFDGTMWAVGLGIAVISLAIGSYQFNKKDI